MTCPTIIYNGYTLPNVFGPYSLVQTPTDLSFSCLFLLQESSSASLIAAEKTMLEKMLEVKKSFSASFNSTSEFSLSHGTTTGTGFNARVNVTKVAHPELSTELTRVFSFNIKLELPYTQDNGRIKASMSINYLPTRQAIVNFEALYSASTTQNALDVASADTWAETTLASLFPGGQIFEIIAENQTQDQNKKRAVVKKTYKQVLYPPSTDATTLTKVVDAKLSFNLIHTPKNGQMLTSEARGKDLIKISLNYEGLLDHTKIASVDDIANVWQVYLRPRLLSQATTVLKTSTYGFSNLIFFVENENYHVNPSNYTLTANLTLGTKLEDAHILYLNEDLNIITDEGINYIKLWDGKPFTYHLWSLGATLMLIRNVTKVGIDKKPELENLTKNFGLASGVWIRLKKTEGHTKKYAGYKYTGIANAKEIIFYEQTWNEIYLCVDESSLTDALKGELLNADITALVKV